jgi:tagatose 1,6-diphosphate aldolase
MSTLSRRPGATRSFRRLLSDDGFFLVCALDHLEDFDALLGAPSPHRNERVLREKARLIASVAPVVSAVLIDPVAGVPVATLGGALPSCVGVIVPLEEEDYGHPAKPRATVLRADWDAAKAKAAGADMVKLLWFYRPDVDTPVADAQRELASRLCHQAAAAGLTSVIEPIWYATQDEDPTDPAWLRARHDGIVVSALTAADLGADVLKVEFPGGVATEDDRAEATARCARMTAELGVPWVLLSAGVTLSDFEQQLRIACTAGASGYMAGRSVWRDAVGDPQRDNDVVSRLQRLNAIVRRHARPALPPQSLDDAIALPRTWYADAIG